jgi:hypothetical protein
MISSHDASRAHEDKWVTRLQLPALPPSSASQRTDTSALGNQKQKRSNHPVYPHPHPGTGKQLPSIRNLVPGLWEPGTSKSSQRIPQDENPNGSLISSLRHVSPAWSGGPVDASGGHIPQPHLDTNNHDSESKRDDSRQANESKKRPPPSPIERADHERTAPSNSVINSNKAATSEVQKQSQVFKQLKGDPGFRPRSSSESAKQTGERRGSFPQPSHQQEILRDPVGELSHRLSSVCVCD